MTPSHTPVLIVGAGLAGLTAALLLAWRKIPCLLVERHPSTSLHPRARGVHIRSMELLRVVPGLEDELFAASRATSTDFSIVIAQSVTSPPIKTIAPPGGFDASALSPATMAMAGQDRVEPILARRATALGADLRFSTELRGFSQNRDSVSAILRDAETGAEWTVSADYLIAADGNRSMVREALAIATQGPGVLSKNRSILFETDASLPGHERAFALYYLQNPGFAGVYQTTDEPNVGVVSAEHDPERESARDTGPERSVAIVRAALGLPDAGVKVLSVMNWEMSSRVAQSFARGRVFIAGDAAHTMPPTGGLGGQTAIQDGADLAWKLAMVVQGLASPALLDTYDSERRPIGALTAARQTANYKERMRPDRKDLADLDAGLDYLSVAMGYIYRSAGVTSETPDDQRVAESPLKPSGRPGTRLAHVPLICNSATISTLDLVGRDFTLFAAPGGGAWTRAARDLQRRGAPLDATLIDSDAIDAKELFLERTGLERGGALLVRPDGFIAWRSRAGQSDPLDALSEALGRALCRTLQFAERAA